MKKIFLASILAVLLVTPACGKEAEIAQTYGKASVINTTENELKQFEVLPQDANEILSAQQDMKLIDVREKNEYDNAHIKGAINIPLTLFSQGMLDAVKVKTDDYIILYCKSGARSAQAYQAMHDAGYLTVNSMAGGITAWMENGLPVE